MSTDASPNSHSRRWSRLRDLFHPNRRRPNPTTFNSISTTHSTRRSQNASNVQLHITTNHPRANSTTVTHTPQTLTTSNPSTPSSRRNSNLAEHPRHSLVRAYTRRSRRDRRPRRDRHSRLTEEGRVHSNPIPSSNPSSTFSRSSYRTNPYSLDLETGDHFDDVERILPLNTSTFHSSNHRSTTNNRHPSTRPRASSSTTASTIRSRSSAVIPSSVANYENPSEHEIVAVFHRYVDYLPPQSVTSPDGYHTSPFNLRRQPHSTRYHIALRVRDTRDFSQNPEFERELTWNLRSNVAEMTNHGTRSGGRAPYECAASDDQIEALPSFIMEKGETRSVQEIFTSIREGKLDGDNESTCETRDEKTDECGGLMTSYTECAICLSGFEPGDEITALPCGHVFHLTGCVREWLRNHARTCPTCRADICATPASSDGLGSHSGTVATSEELG